MGPLWVQTPGPPGYLGPTLLGVLSRTGSLHPGDPLSFSEVKHPPEAPWHYQSPPCILFPGLCSCTANSDLYSPSPRLCLQEETSVLCSPPSAKELGRKDYSGNSPDAGHVCIFSETEAASREEEANTYRCKLEVEWHFVQHLFSNKTKHWNVLLRIILKVSDKSWPHSTYELIFLFSSFLPGILFLPMFQKYTWKR